MKPVIRITAGLLLCGCATTRMQYLPQPAQVTAGGAYLHPLSQITFPESVGHFRRAAILRYDADGLDVSVGYNLVTPSAHIAATVYVYPAPSLVSIGSPQNVIAGAQAHLAEGEFENRKREVEHAHLNAVVIEQRDTMRTQGNRSYPGKLAVYEYEDLFAGSRIRLRSRLYVFCYVGDKWAIEYRFSYPKDEDADTQIQEFIRNWDWFGRPA